MAADIPSVHALQRPEKVHDLVRQDGDENCLGCKIVGKLFSDPYSHASLAMEA